MTPAPPLSATAARVTRPEFRPSRRPAAVDGGSAGDPAHHAPRPTRWQEARQLAFDCAAPIPPAPVPLRHALGRTLAEDVTALHDMPHYASSAMDGWAVNGSGPWILAEPGQRLAPHQASPIVTGGLIPPGAKAVLRSESGVIAPDEDGLPVLKLGGRAKPGEPRNGDHIRKAAEEAAAGEVLIKAGTVLNPAHLALAALAGHDALPVLGKPVVRLVLTGSEVVSAGVPAPGEVRDTFGPQLAAVVEMLGGICAGAGQDRGQRRRMARRPRRHRDPGAGPVHRRRRGVARRGIAGRRRHHHRRHGPLRHGPPPAHGRGTGRPAADRRHRHAPGPSRRAGRAAGRPVHHWPARQSARRHDGAVHHRRARCWPPWATGRRRR